MAVSAVGLQTHIWNNNVKSVLLLLGFPLLLLLLTWLMVFGHLYVFQWNQTEQLPPAVPAMLTSIETSLHFLPWVLGVALVWFGISWLFHQRMINRATGARAISRRDYPKIYNMLENLCISRGLPMPRFFLIDSTALNAYASGIDEKSYAITLTRGIIDTLDDDELEAVIAHELTHIINRDVRLLIISVIFVGMISFLAEMAWRGMIYSRYRGRRNSWGTLIAGIVLGIGYLFAILLRFALSRKREFLADAGAVELTKNPDAMANALRKIAGKALMKNVPDEVRQMCIENPPGFFSLFATHPPIEERIAVLEHYAGARKVAYEPTQHGPWGPKR